MLDEPTAARIEQATGRRPVRAEPLAGGCIADVLRVSLDGGGSVVVKQDGGPAPRLDLEAWMLGDLAATGTVRTPGVLLGDPDLLVLEHIENDGERSDDGGADFARRLAALHAVTTDRFGYERDTLIGSLDQPNTWTAEWPAFFAERRLLPMARLARDRRGISAEEAARIERLGSRVADLIGELPARPALIHGDLWAGNVLWKGGVVAGVIDPAISYSDPEMELAFIDLMGCFGRAFFDAYAGHAGIRPGFRETRKDLYNLYPLLVHAALFGGGYGASALAIVRGLGF
jgi:fructosamine-3-kinase